MRTVTIGPAPALAGEHANGRACLAGLAAAYRLETVAHFQTPIAALAFVQATTEAPEAMVADVSALHDPAMDGALIRLLDAAALRWPGCRVAVVLGEAQRYLRPQLQHAKARTFHVAQADGDTLLTDLAAYLNLPPRQAVQARIVLVLSAKGGVGKTTLVANLAAALVARHGLRVAVVDGDLTRGDLARLLGLEPAATLLDLIADQSPGGIGAALDRYLARVQAPGLAGGSLALLPAPGGSVRRDQPWTALTTRHAQAILAALGSRFDVVLLDTPPDLQRSSPFPAAVLQSHRPGAAADPALPFLALVVVQPQPMERQGARQVVDFLRDAGVVSAASPPAPHGQAWGVLVDRNRARGNAAALARSLGLEILAAIPYDKRAATAREAAELVYDFRQRRLSRPARAYARLAEQIANGEGP